MRKNRTRTMRAMRRSDSDRKWGETALMIEKHSIDYRIAAVRQSESLRVISNSIFFQFTLSSGSRLNNDWHYENECSFDQSSVTTVCYLFCNVQKSENVKSDRKNKCRLSNCFRLLYHMMNDSEKLCMQIVVHNSNEFWSVARESSISCIQWNDQNSDFHQSTNDEHEFTIVCKFCKQKLIRSNSKIYNDSVLNQCWIYCVKKLSRWAMSIWQFSILSVNATFEVYFVFRFCDNYTRQIQRQMNKFNRSCEMFRFESISNHCID